MHGARGVSSASFADPGEQGDYRIQLKEQTAWKGYNKHYTIEVFKKHNEKMMALGRE